MKRRPNILERAAAYLERMPASVSGSRGHDTAMKVSLALTRGFGLSPEAALPPLMVWNARCEPPWTESDLRHKLADAARSTRVPLGYLLEDGEHWTPPVAATPATPAVKNTSAPPPGAWPARDAEAILKIALNGPGVADLFDVSPVRLSGGPHAAEEAIDALFCRGGADPLLCVGDTVQRAVTAPRESLRGTLAARQFIVPSAMSARTGKNQSGKVSARCLDNTGPRKYLVVECDFSRDRKDGADIPLLDAAGAAGRTVADLCAAVLMNLGHYAPLVTIVTSGGKSLHGWFPCAGVPEARLREFMAHAVRLGGDPATWVRCQFVRMPWGRRDNGHVQGVCYFNPEVLSS